MPSFTDNHSFGRPTEGGDTDDWGRILNEDLIDLLEERVVITDIDANTGNYTAYADALYVAYDTGDLYRGDGTSWNQITLSGTDTRTDVSDNGTTVVSETSDINFGTDLSVTDDGDGTVTVDATGSVTDTRTDVSDSGATIVSETTDINFDDDLSVTDDGDGSATVDLGPDIDVTSVDNQDYNEAVNTQTAQSGTVTIDLSVANFHEVEADGDITISFSNVTSTPPGNSLTLYLYDDDATGPHTITWPASVEWSNGNAETEIPSDGDIEISLLTPDGGTTWRARKSGEAFA